MEISVRPAVRVICLDAQSRVLLLRWCDPYDNDLLWEPPGGGIDPGESPIEAARRELVEETGLDPAAIADTPLLVARDSKWNNQRFVGEEPFFVAHYGESQPELSRLGLLADEQRNLRGHAWVAADELSTLPDRLEPPTLPEVIARLAPGCGW